jgi:hypothetical protein
MKEITAWVTLVPRPTPEGSLEPEIDWRFVSEEWYTSYWQSLNLNHCHSYGALATAVTSLLIPIAPSEASVERMFATVKQVQRKQRNRLSHDAMESQSFLSFNKCGVTLPARDAGTSAPSAPLANGPMRVSPIDALVTLANCVFASVSEDPRFSPDVPDVPDAADAGEVVDADDATSETE